MRIKDLISSKSTIRYRSEEYRLTDLVRAVDRELILQSEELLACKNYAIFLPNSVQYITAYFTITSLDKVIVPIPILAKQLEVVSTLDYCEAGLVFTNTEYLPHLLEFLKEIPFKVDIFNVDDNLMVSVGQRARTYTSTSDVPTSEEDVAIMLHTSGTTSNPKRVMLTHKNLFTNIRANVESLRLTEHDRTLISLPMFFGYCNTAQMLTHLYLGASIVIMDGLFLPNKFFDLVEKERVTNFTGVPSMLLTVLTYRNKSKYNTSSLRYISFGGGNMPVDKLKQLIEMFPHTGFVQTYGLTEASPRVTALLPGDAIRKLGSVGKPIPGVQVRLVNEQGVDVQTNEIGEVLVRGDNVMKGYYKKPEITSETIKDGWLYTGDLAVRDDENFLYLIGRKKNIIISGGLNIYPEEVEELLLSHPAVKEVYVFGQPDNLLGEVPHAKVVLHEGVKVHPKPDELVNFCHERLAGYKVPVHISIESDLEKTQTWKVKRHKEEIKS